MWYVETFIENNVLKMGGRRLGSSGVGPGPCVLGECQVREPQVVWDPVGLRAPSPGPGVHL